MADFLGAADLMEIAVESAGPPGVLRLGEFALASERCEAGATGTAHAVIRPERVRIEAHGSAGDNRVPAMVERVVFLGSATQVMLRLAPGVPLQALVQNDGQHPDLAQGTPVHAYLPPDALRVLAGARGVVPRARRGAAGRQLAPGSGGSALRALRALQPRRPSSHTHRAPSSTALHPARRPFHDHVQKRSNSAPELFVIMVSGSGAASDWRRRGVLILGMRALVISGPGVARVEEVGEPVPGVGQVVVDVRRAGICGTDVELFTGQLAYFAQGKTRFPVRPGHEWCGVVSAVGAEVPAGWLGVRVTGDTMLGCGRCARCRAGRRHVCADRYEVGIMGGWPGALAERVLVPAWSLHRLPDALDDLSGRAGRAGRQRLASRVGRSGRSRAADPGLRAGHHRAADHGLRRGGGRFECTSWASTAAVARWRGRLGRPGYWTADERPPVTYDAVVDCTDNHRDAGLALELAEPAGRVVFIGVSGAPSLIDSRDLVLGDRTAVGILGASAGLAPAIEHYADGRVDPSGLVDVTVGLSQAAEALAGQIGTGSGTKIHIDPGA